MKKSGGNKPNAVFQGLRSQFRTFETSFQEQYFNKSPIPNILYSYTNIAGLKGILESKKWWASHSQHFNDSQEIIYGDQLICARLDKHLTQLQGSVLRFLEPIYEDVQGKPSGNPSISRAFDQDIYMVSFSEEGDLLDQWRAYGDDGAGYSVGINPHKLSRKLHGAFFLGSNSDDLPFIKVIYEKADQITLIENVLQEVEKIANANVEEVGNKEFRDHFVLLLGNVLWQLALIFKHPAYRNEQEYRVIKPLWNGRVLAEMNIRNENLDSVLFRTKNTMLIPYLELDFSSASDGNVMPITKITLGPKLKNTNAEASLRKFLSKLGYGQELELLQSSIPYR